MSALHIPTLAAEPLFTIGALPVTNALINGWIAVVFFAVLGFLLRTKNKLVPDKLQNIIEWIIEKLLGYFDQVTGSRAMSQKFLPIVAGIFLFILFSNWIGILPGVGSVFVFGKPLFRPANSDINLTLAMAISVVTFSHFVGIFTIGFFKHLDKFVRLAHLFHSFKKGPMGIFRGLIDFVVGFIEILSEIAKVLSLSLRLFGNIFAGEVLLSVIAWLIAFILPTPFMMLELLVGVIQASIFSMLTLVYLSTATHEAH